MKFLKKIKDFYQKDTSTVNESNDLNILVRVLCTFNVVFLVAYLILFLNGLKLTLLYANEIVFALLYAIIFGLTYKLRSKYTLYVYSVIYAVNMGLLTLLFGTNVGYHSAILVLILLYFYNTRASFRFRFLSSCVIMGIIGVVWYIAGQKGSYVPVSFKDLTQLSFFFIFYLGLSIVGTAWFYNLKFAKSEEDLLKYNQYLEEMSITDTLTRLKNRRGIYEYFDEITSKHRIHIAMSDIDFFKKVNDSYGHDIGDKVLARIAEILTQNFGTDHKKGLVGRWGGEEFLIISIGDSYENFVDKLNDVREQIEKEVFEITKEKTFHVSMTFGASQYEHTTLDESIKVADNRLYKGKQSGRNKVVSE